MNPITTVLVEPESTDMTVIETVKEELGIDDEKNDAKLWRYIRQASLAIQRYLDRPLAQATVTDSFLLTKAVNIIALHLSRPPIVSLTSVVEAAAELDESGWILDEETGTIWRASSGAQISWAMGQTEITYVGGYIMLTDLPEDLEQACLMLVAANWFRSGRDPYVRQESIPGVMDTTYWIGGIGDSGAMPPDVISLLTPYRRLTV